MKVRVGIHNVPDTTAKIIFTGNNTQFNPIGVQYKPNPYVNDCLGYPYNIAEIIMLPDSFWRKQVLNC